MLSQIPMITESAAAGIAEERHTLNTLFEAFEACATDRERSELLFNTEVRAVYFVLMFNPDQGLLG